MVWPSPPVAGSRYAACRSAGPNPAGVAAKLRGAARNCAKQWKADAVVAQAGWNAGAADAAGAAMPVSAAPRRAAVASSRLYTVDSSALRRDGVGGGDALADRRAEDVRRADPECDVGCLGSRRVVPGRAIAVVADLVEAGALPGRPAVERHLELRLSDRRSRCHRWSADSAHRQRCRDSAGRGTARDPRSRTRPRLPGRWCRPCGRLRTAIDPPD